MPGKCWTLSALERENSRESLVSRRGGGNAPMKLVIVAAYAGAAFLSYRAARKARREAVYDEPPGSHPAFWMVLAVLMLLLAVNRQFDLLPWLTRTGRTLAKTRGWYQDRRMLQTLVMVGVGAGGGGLLMGCCCYWLVRGAVPERVFALVGLLFVLSFVVIQAMSYHEVDVALRRRIMGLRLDRLLELSGIACVGLAAYLASRAPATDGGARTDSP